MSAEGWVLAGSIVVNVALLAVVTAVRRRRPTPVHARVRPSRDWPERGGYTPGRTVDLDHLPQPKDTGPAPGATWTNP